MGTGDEQVHGLSDGQAKVTEGKTGSDGCQRDRHCRLAQPSTPNDDEGGTETEGKDPQQEQQGNHDGPQEGILEGVGRFGWR